MIVKSDPFNFPLKYSAKEAINYFFHKYIKGCSNMKVQNPFFD